MFLSTLQLGQVRTRVSFAAGRQRSQTVNALIHFMPYMYRGPVTQKWTGSFAASTGSTWLVGTGALEYCVLL